jgi:hypothetical protein
MAENLPSPIDRAALERILQRAAELQAGEHELGERMTSDEVLALGKEVGIPQRYLQQAMLEEQTRGVAAAPSGALDRIAGPGSVVAQRVVAGTPETVADALCAYMEQNELLCIQRRQARSVTFEPIGGFQAAIRRSSAALGQTRRPFLLDKAGTVAAAFTPLEDGYVHVLLQADVRAFRAGYVGGGAALASTGVAAAAVLGVLDAFLPLALAPLPLGFGVGWGVMRMYPSRLPRIQLGLERALDHLEQGHASPKHQLPKGRPGPGFITMLVDEVRKNMR